MSIAEAKYEYAKPSRLAELAGDEDWLVRYWVAANSRTPLTTLKLLAEDPRWEVRSQVIKNPSTPLETLRLLAEDENVDIRMMAKFEIVRCDKPNRMYDPWRMPL